MAEEKNILPEEFDLSPKHIRKELIGKRPTLAEGQKDSFMLDALTWMAEKERISERKKLDEKEKVDHFNEQLESWSKGEGSIDDVMNNARELLQNTAKDGKKFISDAEEIFEEIGCNRIQEKDLTTLSSVAAKVLYIIKLPFISLSNLLNTEKKMTLADAKTAMEKAVPLLALHGLTPRGSLLSPERSLNTAIIKKATDDRRQE